MDDASIPQVRLLRKRLLAFAMSRTALLDAHRGGREVWPIELETRKFSYGGKSYTLFQMDESGVFYLSSGDPHNADKVRNPDSDITELFEAVSATLQELELSFKDQ